MKVVEIRSAAFLYCCRKYSLIDYCVFTIDKQGKVRPSLKWTVDPRTVIQNSMSLALPVKYMSRTESSLMPDIEAFFLSYANQRCLVSTNISFREPSWTNFAPSSRFSPAFAKRRGYFKISFTRAPNVGRILGGKGSRPVTWKS